MCDFLLFKAVNNENKRLTYIACVLGALQPMVCVFYMADVAYQRCAARGPSAHSILA